TAEPMQVAVTQTANADPSDPEPTPDGSSTEPDTSRFQRLIVYSASMRVAVLEIETALETVQQQTETVGGWMQASSSNSITVRIPADRFREFLEFIRGLGRVDAENIVGTDVTDEFYDLEIRLQNAIDLRDRYAALLEQAKNVQEALAIEQELGRITGEIERMKGRMRLLKDQIAFSRITITFDTKAEQPTRKNHISLPFPWLRTYNLQTTYAGKYGY